MRRVATLVATLVAGLAICGGLAAQTFDLQGHRGARGLAPENTLAGFAEALAIGVSTLEMDLAVTRDGAVVVTHNPTLNPDIVRNVEGRWLAGPGQAIRDLGLKSLRTYDVGRINPESDYAGRFPDQMPADGERIPMLLEIVALVSAAGNPWVRFNVETKTSPLRPAATHPPDVFADAVVEEIRQLGIAERTTLQSFDWRTLDRARSTAPELATSCITAEQSWLDTVEVGKDGASPWLAGRDVDDLDGSVPRLVAEAGCSIWSPHHGDLDAAELQEAHSLGLEVIVWTVNEIPDMDALIGMGVDGIITDYPDRLRYVMGVHGLPLPPPTPVVY